MSCFRFRNFKLPRFPHNHVPVPLFTGATPRVTTMYLSLYSHLYSLAPHRAWAFNDLSRPDHGLMIRTR
jgi:hypothetical protein